MQGRVEIGDEGIICACAEAIYLEYRRRRKEPQTLPRLGVLNGLAVRAEDSGASYPKLHDLNQMHATHSTRFNFCIVHSSGAVAAVGCACARADGSAQATELTVGIVLSFVSDIKAEGSEIAPVSQR